MVGEPEPLFIIQFRPIGPRRRWRNIVVGQQFGATIHQLRSPTAEDNLGQELMSALHRAIHIQLDSLNARGGDRVNFTIQSNSYIHAFQSINFRVDEFQEGSTRLDELLQQLANKLNSNESFNVREPLQINFNLVRMPQAGGRPRKNNPGTKCLDEVNRRKRAIVTIDNDDELCCARAIVTMQAYCHREEGREQQRDWDNLRHGRGVQGFLAEKLHQEANVPLGRCGLEELERFQAYLAPQYQPFVMCRAKPFILLFKGPEAPHQIRLLKSDNHYDGCTSFPGFVNHSYYCTLCERGYDHEDASNHPCEGRTCRCCGRGNCPDHRLGKQPELVCRQCHRLFQGDDCLQYHISKRQCEKVRVCLGCKAQYTVNKKKPHRCGMATCPCCQEHVEIASHKCHIQPVEPEETFETMAERRVAYRAAIAKKIKPPPPPPLSVYADIEALQLPDRTFQPILLCYKAEDDLTIHTLYGEDCCDRFLREVDAMTAIPECDVERQVIVLFHNLKGFDGMFLLHRLYAEQRTVEAQLTVGAKVLSFRSGNVTFKDSLCFLPFPLSAFPSTFGLSELKKRVLSPFF